MVMPAATPSHEVTLMSVVFSAEILRAVQSLYLFCRVRMHTCPRSMQMLAAF
jgi:hypothetical protein